MGDEGLAALGATEAVALLRAGELDRVEYVEALSGRARRFAGLRTYTFHDPELPRAAAATPPAHAPLAGLPFAVKDTIDAAGMPTSGGTPALRDWRAAANARVVQRLLDAGGVLMGKQNLGELTLDVTSMNPTYGAVGNPRGQFIAGGSSGGTGAAVAAGLVPAALGSDTGGSCRIPAALCGCVGFRPTLGRYPSEGVLSLSPSRDTVGPLARTVRDVRLIDSICADTVAGALDAELPGLRLGIPTPFFYDDLDQPLGDTIADALDALRGAGATLVEAPIERVGELTAVAAHTLVHYEAPRALSAYLGGDAAAAPTVGQLVSQVAGRRERELLTWLLGPGAVPTEAYHAALRTHRPRLAQAYADCFRHHRVEALLVPTTPLPARPQRDIRERDGVELNGSLRDTFSTYIRNTDPSSLAGLPCLSLPAGLTSAGLPVGLEVVGPPRADARVLAIGEAIERR